jgi:penicillin-binding protein 2
VSTIERLKPNEPGGVGGAGGVGGPKSPQLALRVAILGSLALVMFAIIFFRLWYLQVLTGEQYVQQAKVNDQRVLPIPAPRGAILDRSGQPIVTSRVTNAVQILPGALPPVVREQAAAYQASLAKAYTEFAAARERLKAFETDVHDSKRHASKSERSELRVLHRHAHLRSVAIPRLPRSAVQVRKLFDRLAPVIGLSPRLIDERVIAGIVALPYAPVTVKTDAGRGALTELAERHNDFPGVRQEPVSVRRYPYGEMAAQVLGYVGQVSPDELKMSAFRGVRQGTVVGQEGVEYYYDRYLRGRPGAQHVQVNAFGEAEPTKLPVTQPVAGHSLRLSLDLSLQREAEKALREGIVRAREAGKPAPAGAFTALDPRNGQVLAIGSVPDFNPNIFAKPLSKSEYEALAGSGSSGGSLTNRATEGAYPTGSTFKPITAMAALEAGVITPSEGLGSGQCITVGAEEFCNAGKANYGAVGLVEALKVSSDTYFFEVGERANSRGNIIQRLAHRLGVGQQTGIDLPKEFQGVVPDRQWREKRNKLELQCEHETHVPSCGYVAEVRDWSVGDNMQLAVGQGDLLTDPLQMAVAYSTLANAYMNGGSGTVVRPHLGMEVDDSNGGLVHTLSAPSEGHVRLNYSDLSLVMEGIHEAASQPGGTSADVWAGWNQALHPVFGKTGTAQHEGKEDQSWYMCYIADPKHPIVIAVTVEQGGFGAETAAPIARLIASKWFGQPEKFVAGSSKTQ